MMRLKNVSGKGGGGGELGHVNTYSTSFASNSSFNYATPHKAIGCYYFNEIYCCTTINRAAPRVVFYQVIFWFNIEISILKGQYFAMKLTMNVMSGL